VFLRGTRQTLLLRPRPPGALSVGQQHGLFLCGLTFELSGRQRQNARPGLAKMYRVPPDRAWWPAVGAPLERGVRRHFASRSIPCTGRHAPNTDLVTQRLCEVLVRPSSFRTPARGSLYSPKALGMASLIHSLRIRRSFASRCTSGSAFPGLREGRSGTSPSREAFCPRPQQ
jgi:hypothetical protein